MLRTRVLQNRIYIQLVVPWSDADLMSFCNNHFFVRLFVITDFVNFNIFKFKLRRVLFIRQDFPRFSHCSRRIFDRKDRKDRKDRNDNFSLSVIFLHTMISQDFSSFWPGLTLRAGSSQYDISLDKNGSVVFSGNIRPSKSCISDHTLENLFNSGFMHSIKKNSYDQF